MCDPPRPGCFDPTALAGCVSVWPFATGSVGMTLHTVHMPVYWPELLGCCMTHPSWVGMTLLWPVRLEPLLRLAHSLYDPQGPGSEWPNCPPMCVRYIFFPSPIDVCPTGPTPAEETKSFHSAQSHNFRWWSSKEPSGRWEKKCSDSFYRIWEAKKNVLQHW